MDYEPISDKRGLRGDDSVFPNSGTGKLCEVDEVVLRFEAKNGDTETIDGRLQDGEKHGRGHEFTVSVDHDLDDTTADVDADTVFVRTDGWDSVTGPVCAGDSLSHEGVLGYEVDVFHVTVWASMKLSGRTGTEEDFERQGEHATRPRTGGVRY